MKRYTILWKKLLKNTEIIPLIFQMPA